MYLRRAAVLTLLLSTNLAFSRAADQSQVDGDVQAMTTGKPASQMDAMDDIVQMGSAAKLAVPALIKELAASDAQLQWHAARALSAIGPGAKMPYLPSLPL